MNLVRASFYLTATNIGLSLLTSLNFFFLAATMSPQQLGVLSILLAIPSIGLCLFSSGYHKAAIYYIGRKVYSLETVLTNGIIICCLLEIFLALFLLAFRSFRLSFFSNLSLGLFSFAVLSIPIQIFLFYLTEACLAAEKLSVTVSARVISPIVYVIGCVYAGVNGSLNQESAFICYVAGISLADLIGLGQVIFQSSHKPFFRPDLQAAISCLKFGWQAQVGELAQYLALRLDLILVGIWAGMEASGYYSVATRLAETIWLIAYSTQLALSAKVSQTFEHTVEVKGKRLERTVRYLATVSVLVSAGIILLSFVVFSYFLLRYQLAFSLLLALTPGQIALAIFLLMIANLIGDGRPLLATKLQFTLFFAALIAYIALIPSFGAWGASLATSAAYLISALLAAVTLARIYQIRLWDFLLWKKEDWEFLKASTQYFTKFFAV